MAKGRRMKANRLQGREKVGADKEVSLPGTENLPLFLKMQERRQGCKELRVSQARKGKTSG